jgi:hypothetical protein
MPEKNDVAAKICFYHELESSSVRAVLVDE